jgi:hypothetical protein
MITSMDASRPTADEIPEMVLDIIDDESNSPEATLSAIENAITGLPYGPADVIHGYIDANTPVEELYVPLAVQDMVYDLESAAPESHPIDAKELIEGYELTDKEDVLEAAIKIYTTDNFDGEETKRRLKQLLINAKKAQMDITAAELRTAIENRSE